jgi:hypothetical protein
MRREDVLIAAILFSPFGFLAAKDFKIIWFSILLYFNVFDENYFNNAPCVVN